MKRRHLVVALAIAALLPGLATAQPPRYGDRRPDSRDSGPRGRPPDIGAVIADCERRTDEFRRSFRYASERGAHRDHMRLEDLNRHADRLERVMNAVRDSWRSHRDPGRTRRFVSDAISTGQDINRTMVRARLHPHIERQWGQIRFELNRLAEAFDLPRIRW
jgi:hypothetical protein